ncbi:MAG: hypothetical protein ACXVBH_08795, partial [Flavisolibacter sp.]
MEGVFLATELEVEEVNIKEGALVFRAMNNKLRRRILNLLHEKMKMSVTPIYKKLRIEQSTISS